MSLENFKAFVIPFSIKEDSARKKLLHFLSIDEQTPVKSVCNSRIVSVKKEYYPVERLEIKWNAKWTATSIFMEYWTEQETHYEQQVHYFDRWGREHNSPGFDYFNPNTGKWEMGGLHPINSRIKGYSGDRSSRPWVPREVTVPVTENIPYERETGRRQSTGNVSENGNREHNAQYPLPITDWGEAEIIPYSQEAIKDATVIGNAEPFSESEYNSFLADLKEEAKKKCIQQIPGQKYSNFRMDFNPGEIPKTNTWYFPVYHIIYIFDEIEYEYFVSGYCEISACGKNQKPEDKAIQNAKQQYNAKCSELKDKKKKLWLNIFKVAIGCPVILFFLLIIPLMLQLPFLVFPFLLLPLISAYLIWKNYKEIKIIKGEITKAEEAKNNIVPMLQSKKKAILDIVVDDNLSESEKEVKCNAILETLNGEL